MGVGDEHSTEAGVKMARNHSVTVVRTLSFKRGHLKPLPAISDVLGFKVETDDNKKIADEVVEQYRPAQECMKESLYGLSLIHTSEPTQRPPI